MEIEIKRMVAYLEGFLTIKSYNAFITWSYKITWKKKHVSTTRMPMATKICRIVIYLNRLIPMKPLWLPLIAWYYKITKTVNYQVLFVLYSIICALNINHDYLIMSLRRIKKLSPFEYTCICQTWDTVFRKICEVKT